MVLKSDQLAHQRVHGVRSELIQFFLTPIILVAIQPVEADVEQPDGPQDPKDSEAVVVVHFYQDLQVHQANDCLENEDSVEIDRPRNCSPDGFVAIFSDPNDFS